MEIWNQGIQGRIVGARVTQSEALPNNPSGQADAGLSGSLLIGVGCVPPPNICHGPCGVGYIPARRSDWRTSKLLFSCFKIFMIT